MPRRGTQIPSGLRTTTAYTVDVQLANGLCYAVRIRFSRFERLHAELLRELPGVPLPPGLDLRTLRQASRWRRRWRWSFPPAT